MSHHHRHENLLPHNASLHLLAQNDLVHKDKMIATINCRLAGKSVAKKGNFTCRSTYYSSQTLNETELNKAQYKLLKSTTT
jgi:predicted hotdog family 3-hydroxylacyl-ACP dehydratase